jgi:hypothetical protein
MGAFFSPQARMIPGLAYSLTFRGVGLFFFLRAQSHSRIIRFSRLSASPITANSDTRSP